MSALDNAIKSLEDALEKSENLCTWVEPDWQTMLESPKTSIKQNWWTGRWFMILNLEKQSLKNMRVGEKSTGWVDDKNWSGTYIEKNKVLLDDNCELVKNLESKQEEAKWLKKRERNRNLGY